MLRMEPEAQKPAPQPIPATEESAKLPLNAAPLIRREVKQPSPITSPVTGGDDSPAGIAAAQKLGIAAATKDIQTGNFRILGYGAITQIVDSSVDEETGYRVQYVAGSFPGNAFRAECDAYNFAMREHHQKHQPMNLKPKPPAPMPPVDPFGSP